MANGYRISVDSSQLLAGLTTFAGKANRIAAAVVERHAGPTEAFAKLNAPWTDQTGNARQGLTAVATHSGDSHAIVLFHRVPYGIWLEVRWSGRYQTILPTIIHEGPEVMKTLDRVIASL